MSLAIAMVLGTTFEARAADISGEASVIDGDTIEIDGRQIDLFGIDAVERDQTCERDGIEYLCGIHAVFLLMHFIDDGSVVCHPRSDGRGQRPVAVCTILDEDIAAWLVKSGWALVKEDGGMYVALQEQAKSGKKGIWTGRFDLPWEWRRDHSHSD